VRCCLDQPRRFVQRSLLLCRLLVIWKQDAQLLLHAYCYHWCIRHGTPRLCTGTPPQPRCSLVFKGHMLPSHPAYSPELRFDGLAICSE
jgi:hypothetical protein